MKIVPKVDVLTASMVFEKAFRGELIVLKLDIMHIVSNNHSMCSTIYPWVDNTKHLYSTMCTVNKKLQLPYKSTE